MKKMKRIIRFAFFICFRLFKNVLLYFCSYKSVYESNFVFKYSKLNKRIKSIFRFVVKTIFLTDFWEKMQKIAFVEDISKF